MTEHFLETGFMEGGAGAHILVVTHSCREWNACWQRFPQTNPFKTQFQLKRHQPPCDFMMGRGFCETVVTEPFLETGFMTEHFLETGFMTEHSLETGFMTEHSLETGFMKLNDKKNHSTQPVQPK